VPGSRRRSEFGTLARALALAALKASSQTILDLGNRPVAPKEATRLCTVSFSKSARFDLMHEGKSIRAVIEFR
jgi:hypothetical protein